MLREVDSKIANLSKSMDGKYSALTKEVLNLESNLTSKVSNLDSKIDAGFLGLKDMIIMLKNTVQLLRLLHRPL